MSLSDSLDNAAQQRRLALLQQAQQRREGRSSYRGKNTTGRYDPIFGKHQVVHPDGGITLADSITNAWPGEGQHVQLTQGGTTDLIDFRQVIPSNRTIETLPAGLPLPEGRTVWTCTDGKCSSAFLSYEEPAPARGYATREECESALISPGFTGGQCPGVRYSIYAQPYVQGAPRTQPGGSTSYSATLYGPIVSVKIQPPGSSPDYPTLPVVEFVGHTSTGELTTSFSPITAPPSEVPLLRVDWVRLFPVDAEPLGGCGNRMLCP